MADFAGQSHVEAAWRTLTAEEAATIASRLAFASAIIRSEIPDVDTRIAAGTLDAELVRHVTVAMVTRVLQNPNGYRSEQIEDYSYQRDTSISDGSLYLSDSERKLLTARERRSGAFSIKPTSDPTSYAHRVAAAAHQRSWRE